MAIDRDLINKQIFNGTVTPATGWVSPVVDGFKAGACGDFCNFDAAKAKALYEAAGGYKGTLTMTYNADGAVTRPGPRRSATRSRTPWDRTARAVPTVDFATFQNKIDAKELKGMFRSGWHDGLPVDRELPGPDLRQGSSAAAFQLHRVRQPGVREADRPGGRGADVGRGQRACTSRPRPCSPRTSRPPRCGTPDHVGLSDKVTDVKSTRSGTSISSRSRQSDRRVRRNLSAVGPPE